jgi:hypothetical protein
VDTNRVDAHQHFWRYRPERDAWITEDMAALRRTSPATEGVLAAAGVQGPWPGRPVAGGDASSRHWRGSTASRRASWGGWTLAPDLEPTLETLAEDPLLCKCHRPAEADDGWLRRRGGLSGGGGIRPHLRHPIHHWQLPAARAWWTGSGAALRGGSPAKPPMRDGVLEPWAAAWWAVRRPNRGKFAGQSRRPTGRAGAGILGPTSTWFSKPLTGAATFGSDWPVPACSRHTGVLDVDGGRGSLSPAEREAVMGYRAPVLRAGVSRRRTGCAPLLARIRRGFLAGGPWIRTEEPAVWFSRLGSGSHRPDAGGRGRARGGSGPGQAAGRRCAELATAGRRRVDLVVADPDDASRSAPWWRDAALAGAPRRPRQQRGVNDRGGLENGSPTTVALAAQSVHYYACSSRPAALKDAREPW